MSRKPVSKRPGEWDLTVRGLSTAHRDAIVKIASANRRNIQDQVTVLLEDAFRAAGLPGPWLV